MFLTRTSCCKITLASSYYGAWLGRAVSISVSSSKFINEAYKHKDFFIKYIYIKFFTQSFHRQKIAYSIIEKEIQKGLGSEGIVRTRIID